MSLDWGAEGKLIELTANDLYNGSSLTKVGFMAGNSKALLPNLALQNAKVLKIFRLSKSGLKATVTVDNLTVTAKYPGTFGNKIAIVVTSLGSGSSNFMG